MSQRLVAILAIAVFAYQLGACPCGCLDENYWYQSIQFVSIAMNGSEGRVSQKQSHDTHSHTSNHALNEAGSKFDEPNHETPGHETPGHETPGHETPGHETPGHDYPGHDDSDHHHGDRCCKPCFMAQRGSESMRVNVSDWLAQPNTAIEIAFATFACPTTRTSGLDLPATGPLRAVLCKFNI